MVISGFFRFRLCHHRINEKWLSKSLAAAEAGAMGKSKWNEYELN